LFVEKAVDRLKPEIDFRRKRYFGKNIFFVCFVSRRFVCAVHHQHVECKQLSGYESIELDWELDANRAIEGSDPFASAGGRLAGSDLSASRLSRAVLMLSCCFKLKLKLNESIDSLVDGIRQKQYEFNGQVDSWSDVENQKILSVEYDVHQLLGNLATYKVIRDKKRVSFVPDNLDMQIMQLNQK
jgi:hypothetical protein